MSCTSCKSLAAANDYLRVQRMREKSAHHYLIDLCKLLVETTAEEQKRGWMDRHRVVNIIDSIEQALKAVKE